MPFSRRSQVPEARKQCSLLCMCCDALLWLCSALFGLTVFWRVDLTHRALRKMLSRFPYLSDRSAEYSFANKTRPQNDFTFVTQPIACSLFHWAFIYHKISKGRHHFKLEHTLVFLIWSYVHKRLNSAFVLSNYICCFLTATISKQEQNEKEFVLFLITVYLKDNNNDVRATRPGFTALWKHERYLLAWACSFPLWK